MTVKEVEQARRKRCPVKTYEEHNCYRSSIQLTAGTDCCSVVMHVTCTDWQPLNRHDKPPQGEMSRA